MAARTGRLVRDRIRTVLGAGAALLLSAGSIAAQDPFVIAVYPAATAERGEWEVEAYLNYTATGTTTFDGGVAPTRHQTHLTFELTRGITSDWEASAYILTAYRPGAGAEYAGWRLRSRVHAPARWRLPLDLGLSAEVEGPRAAYGGSTSLELTPILEKQIGPLDVVVNANFDRGLGAGGEGWDLEPSALVAYRVSPVVTAKLEYFAGLGELADPLPASAQVHQFFPGVDLHLRDALTVALGVGAGATTAGNRLVFASRVELEL
jgi:hypothetical protein